MTRGRLALTAVVALLVTLGFGYLWGSSGRYPLQNALEEARAHLDLAEARGQLLDARVSLYNMNFGEASRHFEEAKPPLQRARDRYQQDGNNAAADRIAASLAHIDEAQRLAGKLDQAANSKASDALEAIKVATQR
jgi:hypothetical protein